MLNKVMLIGNVGKDPEVRHLENGIAVATLTLATSERYRDRTTGETKEQTEWHSVILWRQMADFAEKFVRKGAQVYVEGKLRSRSWEDQQGIKHYVTEIVADTLNLLGRRGDSQGSPAQGGYTPQPAQSAYNQPAAQPAYQPKAQPAPQQPAVQPSAPQPTSPTLNPNQPVIDLSISEEDDLPF